MIGNAMTRQSTAHLLAILDAIMPSTTVLGDQVQSRIYMDSTVITRGTHHTPDGRGQIRRDSQAMTDPTPTRRC